jgi:hypothetical protein
MLSSKDITLLEVLKWPHVFISSYDICVTVSHRKEPRLEFLGKEWYVTTPLAKGYFLLHGRASHTKPLNVVWKVDFYYFEGGEMYLVRTGKGL